ncbi:MAG: response regulator transcription factor [Emcibacter sp.]|nr:response regulator transcription factor [Emcibacter sp.]
MRVLIVDQFDICREGMKAILLQMDKNCKFLEADTLDESVALAGDVNFNLIIIDLDVPETGGLGMLDRIKKSNLKGNIVLFSMTEDYKVMRMAFEMGISAFIREQTKKEITISVLQIVLAGGRYFSPEVIGGRPEHEVQGPTSRFLISSAGKPILSNRQLDVLKLLAEGKPNKVIARELGIATGTVKVHIAGILKSLKATNRTQAVSIANHINIL